MKKLALLIMASIMLAACSSDEEVKEPEVKEEAEVETEEKEEAKEEVKEEPKVVEHDDEFKYDGFMVEGIETKVEDNTLHLTFRWLNNTGEKIHFTYLGFVDVMQEEEVLEEVSGAYDPSNKSNILFSNADGGSHRVDLEYEMVNDKDIEIKFGSNQTDKRDTITIELE